MEKLVIASFLHDVEYNHAVIPHIKTEYFEDEAQKVIVETAISYVTDHKKLPAKIVLDTIIDSKINIPESIYQRAKELIDNYYSEETKEQVREAALEWKLEKTLQFFRETGANIVIQKSLDIFEGKYKENGVVIDRSAIPEMMQKAISISFDTSVGHDYFKDAEARYDYMHTSINKIPFKIPILNKITGGGLERGTVNGFLCPPHGGKTLGMGSLAVDWLSLGYNVLCITLEMAEMKIGERIDANMLDVEIGSLKAISKTAYLNKLKSLEDKGYGKLIVRQYPTASAGTGHFRFLLNELQTKQNFVPDIVVLDYLGICISTRFKRSDNMYQIQKSVGEEFRGLMIEEDMCGFTSLQTNRDGMGASDFDMSDMSESSGHAMTFDFLLGLISTDELIALGQVRCKQLKNRYGSIHDFSSFILNMDRKKMKLYQDDEYTRNNNAPEVQHKKPDSIIPKNRYNNLKTLS